jgi:hypothetical protein
MNKSAVSLFAASALLAACGGPQRGPASETDELTVPITMQSCTRDKHLVIVWGAFSFAAAEPIRNEEGIRRMVAYQGTVLNRHMDTVVSEMGSVDFEIIEMTAALGGEVPPNPMSNMASSAFPELNTEFAKEVAPLIHNGQMSFVLEEVMNSKYPHPSCEAI